MKPAFKGTAADQFFFFLSVEVPFTRHCKIFQQRTRLRYGQVPFKAGFTVRVGTRKAKTSFEQQPERKPADFYLLVHRTHPFAL